MPRLERFQSILEIYGDDGGTPGRRIELSRGQTARARPKYVRERGEAAAESLIY